VVQESLIGISPQGKPRHTSVLLEQIELAATASGGWGGVDLIAVGLGPGSFTGIRIAVATARGLALSTGLAAVGICTLDAIGRALAERGDDPACLAVIDARRGEVFSALYSERGERLWEPWVGTPEDLLERLGRLSRPPLAAGSGALRFRPELARHGVEIPEDADPVHRVTARHICALAANGEPGTDGPLDPIYLRPPDAVRWRERDTFQTTG
jgi:tRNA threonylcarbamoyladenosine biosynthesis protein TsaB